MEIIKKEGTEKTAETKTTSTTNASTPLAHNKGGSTISTSKTSMSITSKQEIEKNIQNHLEADDFEIADPFADMAELSQMAEKEKSSEVRDLEYFSNLPSLRQIAMLKALNVTRTGFHEVIKKHRRESVINLDAACEKLKAEQLMSKPKEKSEILRLRYKREIETFVNNGIKPARIAVWLTEHDKANYPKAKQYVYSVSLVKAFVDGVSSVNRGKSLE
jgi:hypothetical protein